MFNPMRAMNSLGERPELFTAAGPHKAKYYRVHVSRGQFLAATMYLIEDISVYSKKYIIVLPVIILIIITDITLRM